MQIKIWGAAAAMAAMSFTVSAAEDGRNWLTLGLNVVYGHVDTPCGGSSGDRCSEQGPLNGFTGAFTTYTRTRSNHPNCLSPCYLLNRHSPCV